MFLSIHPASKRMSKTIPSRIIYEEPESHAIGYTRKECNKAAPEYKRHILPHVPAYPSWRGNPKKPGDTAPAFCRQRLLHSHPQASRSHVAALGTVLTSAKEPG